MFSELRPYADFLDGPLWTQRAPAHWSRRRLKSVAVHLTTPPETGVSSSPYVALEHVEGWTGRVRLDPAASYESQVKKFRAGDVLFGKLRPYLAKVAAPHFDGVCASEFLVIRPRATEVMQEYLALLMRSAPFVSFVDSSTAGARMPRTDWGFVGSTEVFVPPLAEQEAIVKYLAHAHARIDRAIDAKRNLIALLEEERRALIETAIFGPSDGQGKVDESGNWPRRPVQWFASQINERSGVERASLPLLSVSIRDGVGLRSVTVGRDTRAEELTDYKICRPGDLVLNRMRAFQGAIGVSSYRGLVSPDYLVATLRSVVDVHFIEYLVRSSAFIDAMSRVTRGIGSVESGGSRTPRVNPGDFMRIAVPIPTLQQQRAIVDRLDADTGTTVKVIDRAQREIELLREFRTRLTADVVTGQVDVRKIAAVLPEIDPAELGGDVTGESEDDLDEQAIEYVEDVPS